MCFSVIHLTDKQQILSHLSVSCELWKRGTQVFTEGWIRRRGSEIKTRDNTPLQTVILTYCGMHDSLRNTSIFCLITLPEYCKKEKKGIYYLTDY